MFGSIQILHIPVLLWTGPRRTSVKWLGATTQAIPRTGGLTFPTWFTMRIS